VGMNAEGAPGEKLSDTLGRCIFKAVQRWEGLKNPLTEFGGPRVRRYESNRVSLAMTCCFSLIVFELKPKNGVVRCSFRAYGL
jgi:hypothetical protein